MNIKKVGIAGAGLMGASMSQIFAKFGYEVTVYDAFEQSLEKGKQLVKVNQAAAVESGEATREEADRIVAALKFTNDMKDLADSDIIVESIVEKLDVKQVFWKNVSELVRPDALLTTNTSGISIDAIAKDIVGKNRFLGMHWMNPAHLIPCIEIIRGTETDDESTNAVIALAHAVGKKTTVCKKDVPGFILNRIQQAILRECISLVEDGLADVEDVDNCMKYGLGFRYAAYGPFEIADFGGIDTFHHISEYLYPHLCNAEKPQKLMEDLYKNGNYGVKNGKGFYDYTGKDPITERDKKFVKIYNALYKD